jgi:CBS domain-containing protein
MKVVDVMTAPVITVSPETPLKRAAALMLEHRISGVPVVADGRLVGVLSETDILFKERTSPQRQGLVDWVLHYGDDPPAAKLAARTARDAMTTPAVTVQPRRRVADAAALLLDIGIDRLPVVDGDQLVGIVTRSDLVRAFVRSDEQLEAEIRRDVVVGTAWMPEESVDVTVADGDVILEGSVETETVAELIESQVRSVAGVVSVESRLEWPEGAGV